MVLTVPGRQPVQIVLKGVVARYEPRAHHQLKVTLACGLHRLKCRQQGFIQAVVHQLPVVGGELLQFLVTAERILCRQPHLHLMLHHVIPQKDVSPQEILDLLNGGIFLPPVLLVFFLLAALLGGFLLSLSHLLSFLIVIFIIVLVRMIQR